MNERIRELAEQAQIWIADYNGQRWEIDTEKFAELIIEECLSVIEEMNPHDPERDIDDIFNEVDKHFGVEK